MTNFVKAALIRAIRTVCQAAIGLIPASAMISEVDWRLVASASLLAGIVSLLTSIATGLPEVEYKRYLNDELEGEEDPDDDEIEEEYYDD